ncbi:hypothetical protein DWF00_22720 [Bosea caraganae]|uniref:Uncharacterized protein n=1 Tax=Bosea caraganae TaxID=2763117 RepID=A0A370L1U1_9HYPH|nr:hypothetical protein [Bosea caraganae]RDJ21473.1 hypothetical protein DWE98_20785 [Bosea caraganae]RDJ23441.1 hypothetical protein DWF00_22720 [Bosea caraganae]
MDLFLGWLLRQMRRARYVFVGLYLVSASGFLFADPSAGWTWFIVISGALLCLLFWGLVAFWTMLFTQKQDAKAELRRDNA